VAFAIEDGPAAYLPMRHKGGDNLDPARVVAYLKDQAACFGGDIVGAHLPYDIDFLAEEGIEFRPRRYRDVQVAEPLLDEHQMSYSLEAIAGRHGLPGKDESLLRDVAKLYNLDPKKDLWRLPARYVGAYAEQDVRLPHQLIRRQERQIEEQGLNQIYDLECRVLPVLVRMRRRGVRVDFDQLDRVEAMCAQREQSAVDLIFDETGIRMGLDDINKKTLVAQAMNAAHLSYGRTATGQPQIDATTLSRHKNTRVGAALIEAKKYNKVRTTFVAQVRRHATNGRVHCTFNQLRTQRDNGDMVGAGPGRLSSTDFNIQNQPSKGSLGKAWRSSYVPEEGGEWAAVDLSSQEPRMAVHYAHISKCPGADVAWQMYQDDPNTDFHSMTTRMAYPDLASLDKGDPEFDKRRKTCKTVFLGLLYSMGGAKLCRTLGYRTKMKEIRGVLREVAGDEGQAFLDNFHKMVPWMKTFVKKVEYAAKRRGYIVTILGRHCRVIPGSGDERKSPNNLIQGSSADQVKQAMVLLEDAGYPIQIQVHDEVDTTIYSRQQAKEMAEIIEHSVPQLTVPSVCDIEIGSSWGDSMK
jgi:DNA polymerase I-like protein with 3'-5' exonuclease and polymerase domains